LVQGKRGKESADPKKAGRFYRRHFKKHVPLGRRYVEKSGAVLREGVSGTRKEINGRKDDRSTQADRFNRLVLALSKDFENSKGVTCLLITSKRFKGNKGSGRV